MNTLDYLKGKFRIEGNNIFNVNRTLMAEALGEMNFNRGAEIGVAEGYHAEVLYQKNELLFLYLVDAWTHYPGYQEYADMEKVKELALTRLQPFPRAVVAEMSMKAVAYVQDSSLDFVYLDAGHDFKNVAMDISEWSKKVVPGGIVFGHDYKFHKAYMDKGRFRYPVEVKPVVDAYCLAKGLDLYILHNDISDPTFGRDNPGWMFIRSEGDKL